MKPMTLTDIDEMERLEREATGAMWSLQESNNKDSAGIYVEHEKLGIEIWNSLDAAKDANLIVAARNNLPQLLALARIGLLAVAENEAERALPPKIEEGTCLKPMFAWMEMLQEMDRLVDDWKSKFTKEPKP